MKHSQVSRRFPACSQSRTQSPRTFWSAGESLARQWMPLSPKHRVPVLVRILEMKTEMRDCLVMRIESIGERLILDVTNGKRNWIFFTNRGSDSLPVSVLLLRRQPIKKYYLTPLSQSRSSCSPADQKAQGLWPALACINLIVCILTILVPWYFPAFNIQAQQLLFSEINYPH